MKLSQDVFVRNHGLSFPRFQSVSVQTAALLNLSHVLSVAAKNSEELPPQLMKDISTLMKTLTNSNSALPLETTPEADAITRRWSFKR